MRAGELYFINLLSMGFAADVAVAANRRFKRAGRTRLHPGRVAVSGAAAPPRVSACARTMMRSSIAAAVCFLSFNNSKFTGGKMMIAPQASTNDGLIEYVRWGPIGRAATDAQLFRPIRRYAHHASAGVAPRGASHRIRSSTRRWMSWWTAKCSRSTAAASKCCPARWTCWYERRAAAEPGRTAHRRSRRQPGGCGSSAARFSSPCVRF